MKEKSVSKKHEFEYESPDGDIWDITVLVNDERKYIQFAKRVEGDNLIIPFIMDGSMLLDAADAYRSVTSNIPQSGQQVIVLPEPNITDHRETKGEVIEKQVSESMNNMDHSTTPVQSFIASEANAEPDDYGQFRTGVDPDKIGVVNQTPEEWATNPDTKNMKRWQKDAIDRKGMRKPSVPNRQHGPVRPQFKKVKAGDII